jgi:uncharacterized membrane protein YhaH (DUF805 family)
MPPAVAFVLQLVDPRGRGDRVDFLWAAIQLVAAQVSFALGLWVSSASVLGWRGFLGNLVFGWLGYAAISRRVHDLGHSGWWLLRRLLAWLVAAATLALLVALGVGAEALEMRPPLLWATFAALLLPLLALALWLHVSAGEPAANRFGPAPGTAVPPPLSA